jgi:hypothetical protein
MFQRIWRDIFAAAFEAKRRQHPALRIQISEVDLLPRDPTRFEVGNHRAEQSRTRDQLLLAGRRITRFGRQCPDQAACLFGDNTATIDLIEVDHSGRAISATMLAPALCRGPSLGASATNLGLSIGFSRVSSVTLSIEVPDPGCGARKGRLITSRTMSRNTRGGSASSSALSPTNHSSPRPTPWRRLVTAMDALGDNF